VRAMIDRDYPLGADPDPVFPCAASLPEGHARV
jgi:hypothetical protein